MTFFKLFLIVLSISCFAEEKLDCTKVITTLDINRCMSLDLEKVELVMQTYLAKSKE